MVARVVVRVVVADVAAAAVVVAATREVVLGGAVPSDGVAEHVLTRRPTVKEARPAASSAATGVAGRLPTIPQISSCQNPHSTETSYRMH